MYYPKSQIKTNLYTYGDTFQLATGEFYSGFYWSTSNGRFFTGKNPNDGIPKELFFIIPPEIVSPPGVYLENILILYDVVGYDEDLDSSNLPSGSTINKDPNLENVETYLNISNSLSSTLQQLPTYSPTLPTEENYKIGEFERYFCVKRNQNIYLEIKKDIYDKLLNRNSQIAWQLYKPFKLPWTLTGVKEQVFLTNKNIVTLTSQRNQLVGFNLYLKEDYLKYYNG